MLNLVAGWRRMRLEGEGCCAGAAARPEPKCSEVGFGDVNVYHALGKWGLVMLMRIVLWGNGLQEWLRRAADTSQEYSEQPNITEHHLHPAAGPLCSPCTASTAPRGCSKTSRLVEFLFHCNQLCIPTGVWSSQ